MLRLCRALGFPSEKLRRWSEDAINEDDDWCGCPRLSLSASISGYAQRNDHCRGTGSAAPDLVQWGTQGHRGRSTSRQWVCRHRKTASTDLERLAERGKQSIVA